MLEIGFQYRPWPPAKHSNFSLAAIVIRQCYNVDMSTEEFKIDGEQVLAKIKELLHEGNIRRISIKDENGKTLIEVPLTIGAVGVILAPALAAIGAIAALVAKCTIVVERK